MRIAVVYNQPATGAAPDEQDVLVQAEAVSSSLGRLGHHVTMEACSLDLESIRRKLIDSRVDLVFNLVEALEGTGRLIHFFPSLLEVMGLPYTGSGSIAMLATSNKVIGKRVLSAAGLPTPEWVGPFPGDVPQPFRQPENIDSVVETEGLWIIKSVWEHASMGLGEDSVVKASPSGAWRMLPGRSGRLGGACFAEHYIEGREFNLSVLSGKRGPEVLPPAEIVFTDFPPGTPEIVDYQAKWDETSSAWRNTPRTFDIAEADRRLAGDLENAALKCWEIFNLGGYARVDFRVDPEGFPWVLEVNANPCLSPDAGFAAALDRAGICFDSAIERILNDSFLR